MPGWHDTTRPLEEEGRLRVVGLIQEQHPARCRLFMQWKQMDWPVLVDSLNLLDVNVVPITLLIDEYGVIRGKAPRRGDAETVVREFLAEEFEPPDRLPTEPAVPDLIRLERAAAGGDAAATRAYASALVLWGGEAGLERAIDRLEETEDRHPDDARAAFRLGVAYRKRYDSERGDAEDFGRAVEQWSRALALDPNQYIWRRRIQQYGPRLDKPYPFYDWVAEAREAIEARGEPPVTLPVEPRGAELARPADEFATVLAGDEEPDPDGRIRRDAGKLVRVSASTVPPRVAPGATARVHVELRPVAAAEAHWNNENRGLVLWVDAPEGWAVDRRRIELDNPPGAVSDETRRLEFEVRSPQGRTASAALPAYALYYVCEGLKGQCLYRRQDFRIDLPVQAVKE